MLSEALRLIRVFNDLSQQELAAQVGLSKSYISELESGSKAPSLDVVNRYAAAFQIPASSILFFSESMQSGEAHGDRKRVGFGSKLLNFLRHIEAATEPGDAQAQVDIPDGPKPPFQEE